LDSVRKELKRDIEEQLASQQSVIEMLSNDNSTLKQQKAKIRCDYLQTRNELVSVKVSLLCLFTNCDYTMIIFYRENWSI
jgi:hypothetical protein